MSADPIVAVIVAALGSPLVLQAAKAAFAALRGRAKRDDEVTHYHHLALEWEMTTWETRALAVKAGVPRSELPKGPGEDDRDR